MLARWWWPRHKAPEKVGIGAGRRSVCRLPILVPIRASTVRDRVDEKKMKKLPESCLGVVWTGNRSGEKSLATAGVGVALLNPNSTIALTELLN